jgi:AraC-like DNA-binding protein
MILVRPAAPSLRPYVAIVWTADTAKVGAGRPELILPSGTAHFVLQLSGRPARLLGNASELMGDSVGRAVLGGARADAYAKEACGVGVSVGAVLGEVGAYALFAPGIELAHRHTNLDGIWPHSEVAELSERLERAVNAEMRLNQLEIYLHRKLSNRRPIHPVVGRTIAGLRRGCSIGDVVRELGVSHRHIASTFREAVGLGPKTYQRIMRFNRSLDLLKGDPSPSLADLADRLAYSDQAHLTREFREFSGMTPGEYSRLSPSHVRHVPASHYWCGRSEIFKTLRTRAG